MACWAIERSQRRFLTKSGTGEGNGKHLHHFAFENPMNSMKKQIVMNLKDESPQVSNTACPQDTSHNGV